MSGDIFNSKLEQHESCLAASGNEADGRATRDTRLHDEWVHHLKEKEQRQPLSVRHVQWQQDVDISEGNGHYQFRLPGDSTRKVLFETDATEGGLKKGEQLLKDVVSNKRQQLETEYKVAFSVDDEDVEPQVRIADDCTRFVGPLLTARAPTLRELLGIEAALQKSSPGNLAANGERGVKFYFLRGSYIDGSTPLARYKFDREGRPSVYFEPGGTDGKPILESDTKPLKGEPLESIEAVSIHELTHNGQWNSGWEQPQVEESVARAMGWLPIVDARDHSPQWILKGKDNRYYRYTQEDCRSRLMWIRCQANGSPLDAHGTPVAKIADAARFTDDEVAKLALIKPATWFFKRPEEMHSEALTRFRLGNDNRQSLLKDSPTLYAVVKQEDQREIDQFYGVDADGQPRLVRRPDGKLAPRTESTLRAIAQLESRGR